MVAAAVIGGAALSAGASMIGGSQAAGAANNAAALQEQQYNTTRGDMQPFTQTGQSVLPALAALAQSGPTGGGPNYLSMAQGAMPGMMTEAELEQTPGYQFNLSQGLKATQSAAAARGLGVSGAALKGAATYATGLADSTYQNQFNNAQQRFADLLNLNSGQQGNVTNQYNRLSGVANLGENAAAQTGQQGTQAANAAGGFLTAGGQAQAAGTVGVGNAVSNAANNYLAYSAFRNATGTTGGFGGAGP